MSTRKPRIVVNNDKPKAAPKPRKKALAVPMRPIVSEVHLYRMEQQGILEETRAKIAVVEAEKVLMEQNHKRQIERLEVVHAGTIGDVNKRLAGLYRVRDGSEASLAASNERDPGNALQETIDHHSAA